MVYSFACCCYTIQFSGKVDHALLRHSAAEFNITGATLQNQTSHSFSLKRDNRPPVKNRMRIKAWDDYSAIDVAEPWVQPAIVFYFIKPAYTGYKSYALSLRLAAYNLRGPPANNA